MEGLSYIRRVLWYSRTIYGKVVFLDLVQSWHKNRGDSYRSLLDCARPVTVCAAKFVRIVLTIAAFVAAAYY